MGKPLGSSGYDKQNNIISAKVNFFKDKETNIPSFSIEYDSTDKKLTICEMQLINNHYTKINSNELDITSLEPVDIKNHISGFIKKNNLSYEDKTLKTLYQCIDNHHVISSGLNI